MPKLRQYFLKPLVTLMVFILVLSSCSETSTEQQIKAQIDGMQQAISDKSLADFMAYFSKDFKGNKKLDQNDLKQLIFFQFRRNRNIETYKWQAEIKLESGNVEVEIYVVVSGSEKVIPERGKVYTINSVWKKIDGSWLIVSANWKSY